MGKKIKRIKLKPKIKQIASIIMATVLSISIIPVSSVYAGGNSIGTNTGSSTNFGKPSGDPAKKFGDFQVEGVRCYIYDKSDGNILASDVFGGKKVIDFLGYSDEVMSLYNQVDVDDISTVTALGSVDYDEIEFSYEYPFTFDSLKYYYAHYILNGTAELTDEIVDNSVVSGTDVTNGRLRDNNAQELANILIRYWGEQVLNQFRRNSNLMFIIEPIFIVSVATGEAVDEKDVGILGDKTFQSGVRIDKVTDTITKYFYVGKEADDECWANNPLHQAFIEFKNTGNYKFVSYQDFIDNNVALAEIENAKNKNDGSVSENTYNTIIENYNNGEIDHFEYATASDEYDETVKLYRAFKYVYGTGRELYNQQINGLEIASNYTIADSVNNAVYCKEIGENGKYNSDYNLVFPSGFSGNKPLYNGQPNVLEIDRVPTTWGMAILASKEFNESIWHTNDYQTDRPSGVPTEDRPNYPNDAYQYGNNIVEKIYEIRDKETDEIKATTSVITTGIGDTIEIEEEYIGETGTGSKGNYLNLSLFFIK